MVDRDSVTVVAIFFIVLLFVWVLVLTVNTNYSLQVLGSPAGKFTGSTGTTGSTVTTHPTGSTGTTGSTTTTVTLLCHEASSPLGTEMCEGTCFPGTSCEYIEDPTHGSPTGFLCACVPTTTIPSVSCGVNAPILGYCYGTCPSPQTCGVVMVSYTDPDGTYHEETACGCLGTTPPIYPTYCSKLINPESVSQCGGSCPSDMVCMDVVLPDGSDACSCLDPTLPPIKTCSNTGGGCSGGCPTGWTCKLTMSLCGCEQSTTTTTPTTITIPPTSNTVLTTVSVTIPPTSSTVQVTTSFTIPPTSSTVQVTTSVTMPPTTMH